MPIPYEQHKKMKKQKDKVCLLLNCGVCFAFVLQQLIYMYLSNYLYRGQGFYMVVKVWIRKELQYIFSDKNFTFMDLFAVKVHNYLWQRFT